MTHEEDSGEAEEDGGGTITITTQTDPETGLVETKEVLGESEETPKDEPSETLKETRDSSSGGSGSSGGSKDAKDLKPGGSTTVKAKEAGGGFEGDIPDLEVPDRQPKKPRKDRPTRTAVKRSVTERDQRTGAAETLQREGRAEQRRRNLQNQKRFLEQQSEDAELRKDGEPVTRGQALKETERKLEQARKTETKLEQAVDSKRQTASPVERQAQRQRRSSQQEAREFFQQQENQPPVNTKTAERMLFGGQNTPTAITPPGEKDLDTEKISFDPTTGRGPFEPRQTEATEKRIAQPLSETPTFQTRARPTEVGLETEQRFEELTDVEGRGPGLVAATGQQIVNLPLEATATGEKLIRQPVKIGKQLPKEIKEEARIVAGESPSNVDITSAVTGAENIAKRRRFQTQLAQTQVVLGGLTQAGIGIRSGGAIRGVNRESLDPEQADIEVVQGEEFGRVPASQTEVGAEGDIVEVSGRMDRGGRLQGVQTGDQTIIESQQPMLTALIRDPDTGEIEEVVTGSTDLTGVAEGGKARGAGRIDALRVNPETGNVKETETKIFDFETEQDVTERTPLIEVMDESSQKRSLEETKNMVSGTVGDKKFQGIQQAKVAESEGEGLIFESESATLGQDRQGIIGENQPLQFDQNVEEIAKEIGGEDARIFVDKENFRRDFAQLGIDTKDSDIQRLDTFEEQAPDTDTTRGRGETAQIESKGVILQERQLDESVQISIDADEFIERPFTSQELTPEKVKELKISGQDIFGTSFQNFMGRLERESGRPGDDFEGGRDIDTGEGMQVVADEPEQTDFTGIGTDAVSQEGFEKVARDLIGEDVETPQGLTRGDAVRAAAGAGLSVGTEESAAADLERELDSGLDQRQRDDDELREEPDIDIDQIVGPDQDQQTVPILDTDTDLRQIQETEQETETQPFTEPPSGFTGGLGAPPTGGGESPPRFDDESELEEEFENLRSKDRAPEASPSVAGILQGLTGEGIGGESSPATGLEVRPIPETEKDEKTEEIPLF